MFFSGHPIRTPNFRIATLTLTLGLALTGIASGQQASSGWSQDLDSHQALYNIQLPAGKTTADIRAMAIAGSNDHVYTWYDDNTVSEGTSWDLDAYSSPQPMSPLPGYSNDQIMAAAIASNNHVYYYWRNGTVTQGTSTAPMAYALPLSVDFPDDKNEEDLRGVGIAGSNNHVYAWYADGTVSEGTSTDLFVYNLPTEYSLGGSYNPEDLAGVAIAGSNDRVFAWYHAPSVGTGYSTIEAEIDSLVLDFMADKNIAGATVAVSKQGNLVFDKGYGTADLEDGTRMEPFHRSRVGSVSKIVTTLALMKYAEDQDPADLSVLDEPLYGFFGLMPSFHYLTDQTQGRRRHTPVVGTVIRKSDNRVFTYYDNGTAATGTTSNQDASSLPAPYELPADQEPSNIRGMAADSSGNVFTWYLDGSLSAGTFYDLDASYYLDASQDEISGVALPSGQSFKYLVGVAIAPSTDKVYAWFENGARSVGHVLDLGFYDPGAEYTAGGDKTPYDIRSMAIASNDRVYAFYGDETVSSGASWDLDRYLGLYDTSLAAGITAQPWHLWYSQMTPRHLVTHTAGFSRSGDTLGAARMFDVAEDDLNYEQAHRYMLAARPLLFAPGTSNTYSNHGLGLTGFLLEELTGQFYPDYAQAEVLDPIGLEFGRSWDQWGALDARPHKVIDDELVRCQCPSSDLSTQAGGWTASAGDLVRLMLATDQDPGRPDILLPTTLSEMESAPFPSSTDRAHGWGRTNQGKLSHNGSTGGGRAYIAKFPDGYTAGDGTDLSNVFVAIAINTNGGDISLGGLADDIVLVTGSNWISSHYDLY